MRLPLALIAAVAGASLIPATVAAGRPTEEVFSPVGDQFLCDGTLVTVQSGTILEREHVRELGSGLSHVVVIETPSDVTLTVFLLRRKKNGEEIVRDRGSCHFT